MDPTEQAMHKTETETQTETQAESGSSLAVTHCQPSDQGFKSLAQEVLESPDMVEIMVDHMRSSTIVLALCNKTLQKLYLQEGLNWKSRPLFAYERQDKNVLDFVEARVWSSVRDGMPMVSFLLREVLESGPPQVQLITFPIQMGYGMDLAEAHFDILNCKTWGELEMEVRKKSQQMRSKGVHHFRIQAETFKTSPRTATLVDGLFKFLRLSNKYQVYETRV